MEHKKLLENVMIDLLKDPTCPIYQYQDWQLINICQQLQIQNFSNIKDQDFQKKFAQFFINYLEQENEIQNILEQSQIKRSDSKKIKDDYEDLSHQNNQCIQNSDKQKQDQFDSIRNKKKLKLNQQKRSDQLEMEEVLCTPNSANQQLVIPQAPNLTQYNFDPPNDDQQDKIHQKEKIQKITSKELEIVESLNYRQDKDNELEPMLKKKNKSAKESNNQDPSHSIFKSNDNLQNKNSNNDSENNRSFVDNNFIEQNQRKNKQIQFQQKPSRAIIDSSAEEGEIIIQISDSESQKQKNTSDQRNKKGKYLIDDLIQLRSNKIHKKDINKKSQFQQKNIKDQDFKQLKQPNNPSTELLLNKEQLLPSDRIEFEIQMRKQQLENQYSLIQSQPSEQKLSNHQQNSEKINLNSSMTNISNSILQQRNQLFDIHNLDQSSIQNKNFGILKEPSNFGFQNQQINQNIHLAINKETNNELQKQNIFNNQRCNQNKQLQFQKQLQYTKQNFQIPIQQFNQPIIHPQSEKNSNQILEKVYDKKPKIETIEINNNHNMQQQNTQNKSFQSKALQNQCNYCKQIDGKIKITEVEDEVKVCSSCLLEKLNPFKKIIYNLGYLEYQYQSRSQSKFHLDFTIKQGLFLVPGMQLEIRCVMMNKNGLSDFTFPNSCNLLINGVIIKEFKPLIDKSCLKKRKDQCISISLDVLQNTYGNLKKYTFTCVETIPDSKMRQETPQQIYIFGLFLVQEQSLDQVIQFIVNQSIQSQIKIDICKNEIKVDKSKVSLICQYSFDLIKIPARGEFCQHQQCFNLNNYLEMMKHAEHMKWICPICKKICFSLRIDHYQWEILKKLQQLNIKVDYITVDQNGNLDSKDPLYAIIQDKKIKTYGDLISQGYNNFERSFLQFDNDSEIISQNQMQPQGNNEINAILID